MGLLYQKYSAPFEYLETLLQMGKMPQGVKEAFRQENDRQLWELYLHSYPTKSFNDWKQELAQKNKNSKALTDTEMGSIISKSQDILKTFSI